MESVIQNWFVFRIAVAQYDELQYVLMIIPFVLFLELPLYFVNWLGVLRHYYQKSRYTRCTPLFSPCNLHNHLLLRRQSGTEYRSFAPGTSLLRSYRDYCSG